LEQVYAEHDNWKRPSRLNISSTNDHSNPKVWVGDLNTNDLDAKALSRIWRMGYHIAKDYLSEAGYKSSDFVYNASIVNMLSPLDSSTEINVLRSNEEDENIESSFDQESHVDPSMAYDTPPASSSTATSNVYSEHELDSLL